MSERSAHDDNVWSSRSKWAFVVFAIIGAFFLVTEHRAHLLPYLSYLPWLLLAACPLMHFFMHGGHGGHDGHHARGGGNAPEPDRGGGPEGPRASAADPRQGEHPHHGDRP